MAILLTVDMKSETTNIPTKRVTTSLHPSQPIAIESGSISVINYTTSQIMETISCGKGFI
jgi:hypothetical protein